MSIKIVKLIFLIWDYYLKILVCLYLFGLQQFIIEYFCSTYCPMRRKYYNYGIDHKYYVGMLEKRGKKVFKQYNINFNEYINSGVILSNLEEIRKKYNKRTLKIF